jgi:hypothetical protein
MPNNTDLRFRPDGRDSAWSPDWTPVVFGDEPRQLESLPQPAFIWWNFMTYTEFWLGGVDFSERQTPVCLLDFVLMLQAARTILRQEGTAAVDLSDRTEEWVFTTDSGRVRLRTRNRTRGGWDYGPGDGSCLPEDFEKLVDQALVDALFLIQSAQPALRNNAFIRNLVSDASSAGLRRPPPV